MRNINAKELAAATAAFTLVWATAETALTNITSTTVPGVWWLVKYAAAAGIFTLAYTVVLSIYQTRLFEKRSIEQRVCGIWYQIFHITNYSSQIENDAIRYGKVSITLEDGKLTISASSNKPSAPTKNSHWYSDQVTIQNQQIWLVFKSSGPGRGETVGMMQLQFQGQNPSQISGSFNDASPSKHFGYMELFRQEEDYRKKLRELLPSIHV